MKLAVVVDTFPRWSERFIARELQALRRAGVELRVFCLKAGSDPLPGDAEWEGLLPLRVVLPSCLVPALRSDAHLTAEQRHRRARAKTVLGATGYAKIRCAEVFSELLRDEDFTHVHAHFASLPSTVGWLGATEAGLPFTLSVHARDLFVEAQCLAEKCADARAIFCCHGRAAVFLRARQPQARVVSMAHGLHLDGHPLLPRPSREGRAPLLMTAGRYVEKKGLAELLEALAEPALAELRTEAVLIGEGPLEHVLQRRAKRADLAGRVTFLPPMAPQDLQTAFAAADLFVAPYRVAADGDADGIPNVLLEALAAGCPVAATAGMGDGHFEEVTHPLQLLAPAPLAASLAAALSRADTAARVKHGRQMIETYFDAQINIAPLLSEIKAAEESRGGD